MLERTRPDREVFGPGPSGLGDIFSSPAAAGGAVTVTHGPYCEDLPVGGMTVAQVRTRFSDRFDIDPSSQAIVDGHEVGDDTLVRSGQVLMFARRAGEKGEK